MKKDLAFKLGIWLLVFAVLEVGIRIHAYSRELRRARTQSIPNTASLFVPHPFLAYAANPDHAGHNAQGYRAEKSKTYEAGADAINIVCLGGSSTYGTRVPREHSYPYLLEEALSTSMDRKINVINGGLGGYSTPNIISLLSLKMVHFDPQITIFYVGFNDAWNRLFYADFQKDYSHAQRSWRLPGFPFWRHSKLLDEIADRFGYPSPREPHIHSVAWRRKSGRPESNLPGSSTDAFRRNLITLIAISRANGSIPIMATQATDFENHPPRHHQKEWMEALEEHTEVIKQTAAELSVDLIDIRDLMTDEETYFADMLHMSEKGNRKRAELIADYLIENQLLEDQ